MKKNTLVIFAFLVSCFWMSHAYALEGDWEAGGDVAAMLMPSSDIYGGGVDLYARYHVIDGLGIGGGIGLYGAHSGKYDNSFALFNFRVGAMYSIDIIEWVPSFGVHLSALFSKNHDYSWHRKGRGMGLDFDAMVQYRGIPQIGIGAFFRYHLVFTDNDYMTVGLCVSWFSGIF